MVFAASQRVGEPLRASPLLVEAVGAGLHVRALPLAAGWPRRRRQVLPALALVTHMQLSAGSQLRF